MRLLHLLVIGALVFAAAYVYRIKMDSTVRTERVLKLHAEIREERDNSEKANDVKSRQRDPIPPESPPDIRPEPTSGFDAGARIFICGRGCGAI